MGYAKIKRFELRFVSFGYEHSTVNNVNYLFDVRFIENPFYNPKLRNLTGLNKEVYEFVINKKEAKKFLDKVTKLLDFIIENFKLLGKKNLTIGIVCSGGKHRSVSIVEYLNKYYNSKYKTAVNHKDISKNYIKNKKLLQTLK